MACSECSTNGAFFLTLSNVLVYPCSEPVSECCRLVRSKELSFLAICLSLSFRRWDSMHWRSKLQEDVFSPSTFYRAGSFGPCRVSETLDWGTAWEGRKVPRWHWPGPPGLPRQVSLQATSIQWAHLLESPLETSPRPVDRERGFDSPSPTCCVPLGRALSLSEPLHHGHGLMDSEGTVFLGEKEMVPSCSLIPETDIYW